MTDLNSPMIDRLSLLSFVLVVGNVIISASNLFRSEFKGNAKNIFIALTLAFSIFLIVPAIEVKRIEINAKNSEKAAARLKDSLREVLDSARSSMTLANLDTAKRNTKVTLAGLDSLIRSQWKLIQSQRNVLDEITGGPSRPIAKYFDIRNEGDSSAFFITMKNSGPFRLSDIEGEIYVFEGARFANLMTNKQFSVALLAGSDFVYGGSKKNFVSNTYAIPYFKALKSIDTLSIVVEVSSRNANTLQVILLSGFNTHELKYAWILRDGQSDHHKIFEHGDKYLLKRLHATERDAFKSLASYDVIMQSLLNDY